MDYSGYTFMAVEVSDGLAVVSLTRPERANACTRQGHEEFSRILRQLRDDPAVRVILLTATGPAFSVGADFEFIDEILDQDEVLAELHGQVRDLVSAHIDMDKPVISSLQGPATGSGLIFALMADFVIAEEHVRFADGHLRLALVAGDGGTLIWPLYAGLLKAKRYLLTGDWITAPEAERCGLVTEVVPTGQSQAVGRALAQRLLGRSDAAMRGTKRALNQWFRLAAAATFEPAMAAEMVSFRESAADVRAAAQAIRDKTAALH